MATAMSTPPRCQRPGPGGPANACAIVSQRFASSPSAVTSRVAGARRWVTSRQKSSAEPVTRCGASSGPQFHVVPSGAISSTRNGSAGAVKAVDREREIACADADVGDGAQPRGRGPLHPDGVGDVEAVRPRLHQPGGGHRRGAHRRAEPEQLAAVGHRQQRVVQRVSGCAPVGKQIGGRRRGDLFRAAVDEPERIGRGRPEHLGEARPRRRPTAVRPGRSTADGRSGARRSTPARAWPRPSARRAGRRQGRRGQSLSARRSSTIGRRCRHAGHLSRAVARAERCSRATQARRDRPQIRRRRVRRSARRWG